MSNSPKNTMYRHNDRTNDFIEENKYFVWRKKKAIICCERFPEGIKFKDKTVLDVGCGHGALSFHAIEEGAKSVLGIDVNSTLINFSNKLLNRQFSKYKNNVSFLKADTRAASMADMTLSRGKFRSAASWVKATKKSLFNLCHLPQLISRYNKESGEVPLSKAIYTYSDPRSIAFSPL